MIPVLTKDGKGIMLDFRQVVLVERRERDLFFHTKTDEYRAITSIEKLTEALETLGFARMEQSSIVRMESIKRYDRARNVVYFDRFPDKNSKEVYVSRENRPMLMEYVQDNRSEIVVIYHKNGKK